MNIEPIPLDADDLTTPAPPPPPWPALAGFATRLAAITLKVPAEAIAGFRAVLEEAHEGLKTRFTADEPVEHLVRDRAQLVDLVLTRAWRLYTEAHGGELALIAVGGYGRGELHPCSDIDVMVLLPKSEGSPWQADLERFLTFLWDIGLEVGHSVRTIDDCQRESLADISVATTLLEARLLAGPEPLYAAMKKALAPDHIWSAADFYEGKVREQQQRHLRFHDTAYNLEPNVKASPGGLRDIQTIAWVAKRHFGCETLDELVAARLSDAQRAPKAQDRARLPVEDPLRAARAHRPARGPAAVRPPDPPRAAVRLRGRDLHARRRAVHAALLPHGDGHPAAERDAAAAV